MNIQQLRYLCCVVDQRFSVSAAARALGTSQPSVSQQLRALETALGLSLLIRRGHRIVGLSSAGEAVIATARRALREADNFGRVASDLKQRGSGQLIVATTHLTARHMLGPVITAFLRSHPGVQLALRQGTPLQIASWVAAGEADMGFGTPPLEAHSGLVYLRCDEVPRIIVVPVDHPLLKHAKKPSLQMLARYPLVVMHRSFPSGTIVADAFTDAGLEPRVVLTAIDVDVIKWYVELGLGIAVLPGVAFDVERDPKLRAIAASHLFPSVEINVELRRGSFLRSAVLNLITMIAPQWSRDEIRQRTLAPPDGPE